MESTASSDMATGLSAAFGAVGLLSALTMYVAAAGHDQVLAGLGFAGAMLAASVTIAALHLWG
jgi:hypothetical protein